MLERVMALWCRLMHRDQIFNITRDAYQCRRCLRMVRYDWWQQR